MKNNIKLYIEFLSYLPTDLKKKLLILVPLLSISGLLEVVSIAGLIPIVNYLLDKSSNIEQLESLFSFMNNTDSSNFIIYFSLAYIVLIVFKGIFVYSVSKFSFKTSLLIKGFFQKKLFTNYTHRDYLGHINSNSSNYIRNITIECNNAEGRLVMPLIVLLSEVLPSLGILLFLLYVNPIGVLFAGTVFILIGFSITYLTSSKLKSYGKSQIESDGNQIKIAQETFSSFKEVQLYKKYDEIINLYSSFVEKSIFSNSNALALGQLPRMVLEITGVIVIFTIAGISLYKGASSSQVIIDLTLFIVAVVKLLPASNKIVISTQTLTYSKPTLENILHELKATSEVKINNKTSRVETHKKVDNITLKNIYFKYTDDSNIILKDVNLELKKGEIIGFRGESGSGKSTLINLILGFLKPSSGKILVDEKDISKSIFEWQSKISYVPQEVILFDDTIKNNIIFFEKTIKSEDIYKIVKKLKLDSFINNYAAGIDTKIGEKGSLLSGGQKQRIGIARAIVRKPSLIIFDESTSAVDIETEKEINNTIKEISKDCIVIIIAHKKSAFEYCDKIYQIKNGKVIQEKWNENSD